MNQSSLQAAVIRLLRPLIRILIRYGVSYGEFAELARRVFVEVATDDFALDGRKQTIARTAMLTGIQRKEVSRLQKLPPIETDQLDAAYNRGVRVSGGWRRDASFQDENGQPTALTFELFSELVKKYSGDLPPRAVLDELLRVGTVVQDNQGLISLANEAGYIPHRDKEGQFNIMGHVTGDLLTTLDHNFEAPVENKHLQLTVAYNNLPEYAIRAFKTMSEQDSFELLKKFDAWLSTQDRDANPELRAGPEEGRYRAGIGIYYFEEPVAGEETTT